MKALTAAEMREVDRLTTERFGISQLQLMENAGKCVADAILRHFGEERSQRVAILCGKGNNGGDGLVAAKYLLSAGVNPQVYLFADPAAITGEAAQNLKRWRESGSTLSVVDSEAKWEKAWPAIANGQVIVDALLGTGLRGAASGSIAQAIEDINRVSHNATAPRPGLILAVDTPSGFPSDGEAAQGAMLRVHKTVTFTAPKIGQLVSRDAAAVGQLQVGEIGSPAALVEEVGQGHVRWVEPQEFAGLPLVREVDSNKGRFGHVLVIAGSPGKSGAAILAGRMALRGGAGLVTVATPSIAWPMVASAQPEYMTDSLEATAGGNVALRNITGNRISHIEKGKTVLAVGPGLGTEPETQEFIRTLVKQTTLPVVLDADGLNAFAGRGDGMRERKTEFLAITPHPGEMARILGRSTHEVQDDRVKAATEAARRWNTHVVLKGFHTVVASPEGGLFVSTSGNAGLAKGGSGDVLMGLLAALIAQFAVHERHRVLALGVYLHGLAAEIATTQIDPAGLLAGDLTLALAQARWQMLQEIQRRG